MPITDADKNRLIFETLNQIRQIKTSKVSMWSLSDRYAYPPLFRFRFSNTQIDDNIYESIKHGLESYDGSLKWTLVHNNKSSNYIIIPKIFQEYIFDENFVFSKESFLKLMKQDEYFRLIDRSIADVIPLSTHIKKIFELN